MKNRVLSRGAQIAATKYFQICTGPSPFSARNTQPVHRPISTRIPTQRSTV